MPCHSRPQLPIVLCAVLLLIAPPSARGSSSTHSTTPTAATPAESSHSTYVEEARTFTQDWLYANVRTRGPADWGLIQHSGAPAYPTCSAGQQQSPVDVGSNGLAMDSDLQALTFSNHTIRGYSVANRQSVLKVRFGTTLNKTLTDPNQAGKAYYLTEIHIHSPAEHAVAGGRAAIEVQLIHNESSPYQSGASRAVVSMLYDEAGAGNPTLGSLIGSAKPVPDPAFGFYADAEKVLTEQAEYLVQHPVDVTALLPAKRDFATYSGSLTRPPCTEGVVYYVMSEVGGVSPEQLSAVRGALALDAELAYLTASEGFVAPTYYMHGNARPLQSLHSRQLRHFIDAGTTGHSNSRGEGRFQLGTIGTVMGSVFLLSLGVVTLVRGFA